MEIDLKMNNIPPKPEIRVEKNGRWGWGRDGLHGTLRKYVHL